MHVHCTTFSLSLPPTPQNKTTIAEIRTKQTCIYTADVLGILMLYRQYIVPVYGTNMAYLGYYYLFLNMRKSTYAIVDIVK